MTHPGSTQAALRRSAHARIMLWSFLAILIGATVLPSLGYLYAAMQPAAQAATADEANPRANYWRSVREGISGYTAVQGQETGVLIQNGGQNWRQARNGPIAYYGGWALVVMVGILALYFLYRGRIKIAGGRSGMVVPRWNLFERTVHWFTAILFVALAITGLSLLFGRAVLIPMLGPEGFAAWAGLSKTVHNYTGTPFVVGVLLMILISLRHNMPTKADLQWIKSVGGMFDRSGKTHPPSHKVNAGEKVVFWVICTFGVAVCVSGLVLNFPNFGQTRETMQLANMVHGAAGTIWIAVMLGHIYLGTLGVEGAWEGMTTGQVDTNWAKQHHNLWYEEVKGQAEPEGSGAPRGMKEQPT